MPTSSCPTAADARGPRARLLDLLAMGLPRRTASLDGCARRKDALSGPVHGPSAPPGVRPRPRWPAVTDGDLTPLPAPPGKRGSRCRWTDGFVPPPRRLVTLSMVCVMLSMFLAAMSQTVVATLLPFGWSPTSADSSATPGWRPPTWSRPPSRIPSWAG